MKLLKHKNTLTSIVEISLEDPTALKHKVTEGMLVVLYVLDSNFYADIDNTTIKIELSNRNLIQRLKTSGSQSILGGVSYAHRNIIGIQYIELCQTLDEDIKIQLDESALPSDIVKRLDVSDFSTIQDWFVSEFMIEFPSLTQSSKKAYLLLPKKDNGDTSLLLLGQKYQAYIEKLGNCWTVIRIERYINVIDEPILYQGEHRIVSSIEDIQSPSHQMLLDAHIQDHGSYFKLWKQYADIDLKQNEMLATEAGVIKFENCKPTEKAQYSLEEKEFEFSVNVDQFNEFIDRYRNALETLGDTYSFKNLVLSISQDETAGVDVFRADNTGLATELMSLSKLKLNEKTNILTGIVQGNKEKIKVMIRKKSGYFSLSSVGVLVQHTRKMAAFDHISQARNKLPQLKSILEGVSVTDVKKSRQIRVSTPSLRRMLKNKKLNSTQERAVKIALNTPDIALIIGPPGTGKTQVISAIQHRIVEEASQSDSSFQHQVLLSSYQHDAVENVVTRSGALGLPAFKVDNSSRQKMADYLQTKSWSQQKLNTLMPSFEKEKQSTEAYQAYERFVEACVQAQVSFEVLDVKDSLELAMDRLDHLRLEHGIELPKDSFESEDPNRYVRIQFECLVNDYRNVRGIVVSKETQKCLYPFIRGIRTTQDAFEDDGDIRLQALLAKCSEIPALTPYQQELLALQSRSAAPEEYLETKEQLLFDLQTHFQSIKTKILNNKERQILAAAMDALEKQMAKSSLKLGQLAMRQRYLNALEFDAVLLQESLKEYATVLGATCQQAAGKPMASLKNVKGSTTLTFDSVIVDEAARANPLDLMIPMSMAERRIVLVGDQQQLPHMLEPRVEKELAGEIESAEVSIELLKQSLFDRLYFTLKKMEREGGAKRVVMLDTQYRMHPLLGDFISDVFYESFGLPKLKSGFGPEKFPLDVPGYENKVASWLAVNDGRIETRGGSKCRESEAEVVAQEAFRLLKERPDLSVGIITFYRAQTVLIESKMREFGVLAQSQEGLRVTSEFALLPNGDERFRIGSVDAFQGKEFDVVLLSTVRNWQGDIPAKMLNKRANSGLGFLRIPNRINVAMSRQKRLLIVVGDTSLADPRWLMAKTENIDGNEQRALLGFSDLYEKLCDKEFPCI